MAEISRAALFGKLNKVAYRAIDSATVFCKLRGNPSVELVHWIHQILQLQDSDLHRAARQFGCDLGKLAEDITSSLERLPRGALAVDLSADVEEAVERAWVYATLMFGEAQVRTGYLLVGILQTRHLKHVLMDISPEFGNLRLEHMTDRFSEITAGSPEMALKATDNFMLDTAGPGETSGAIPSAQLGKEEALKRFTVDLTEQARQGKIDPVVGRDREIRQIIDILMRRRQNNPILTGEAGVGKTAVVEGFARRIVEGDVPPALREVSLRALDVGLLQAGASMKGEFESRLRQVIDEVQASTKPIILFIDEAHTLVGAGGAAGTGDAANLLKPALARGTLRTVAATTWAEYKKHIEKDPALTRRFQPVMIDEPTEERALLMMRGVASVMEQHHRVMILDEALEAAVKLSHRYIPARQLPDKSISLLDTACSRVAVSQHAVPAELDDTRKRIAALQTEQVIIRREASVGVAVGVRAERVAEKLETEERQLEKLNAAWESEKQLVDRILQIRQRLREQNGCESAVAGTTTASMTSNEVDGVRDEPLRELTSLQAQLEQLQGESPLILPSVDYQAVAAVVSDWTGIPMGRMARNEIETVMRLPAILAQRVVGQAHAHEMIARRVQTSRAGLDHPGKPVGVFLLAGSSGVGKTETALALAEALYGGEHNLITINMSEFQEAHTVSTLKGAPPGYVGYGEGGVLTEAVRRKPYSVVLLDEIEKAHSDVHEMFFQVFDKGEMEDSEGRLIDFRNTLILLTTNSGSELIVSLTRDPELMPAVEDIAKALRPELLKVFPAALLGRLVTIPYLPLSDADLRTIIKLQMDRIAQRITANHHIPLRYSDAVLQLVASRCSELESGGRMIDAILTNTILPHISQEILSRMTDGRTSAAVHLDVDGNDFTYRFS